MAAKNISVRAAAKLAAAEDKRARLQLQIDRGRKQLSRINKKTLDAKAQSTLDSFTNFAFKMGVGADSPLTGSSYGFNPITRNRILLEWIHRGSWLGGVAVDLKAEDMTRAGVELLGDTTPQDIAKIEEAIVGMGVWSHITETCKWGRLYGGAIGAMIVDGQDFSTPLRMETIARNQFRGLAVFDRWQLEPSLENLVTDPGPHLGLPKFYKVMAGSTSLPGVRIHHSRCFRMGGIKLPANQRLQENLWDISILERLYDRMVAFDSVTTGAAQLAYKAWIRTYKIEGLRNIAAAGGKPLQGLVAQMEMMRRFQSNEGITLLDAKDEFEAMQNTTFSGLSDLVLQFGQQFSGGTGIPLVRLFGQSPAGLNATGESDLRFYYDAVNQEQNRDLMVPVTRIYRATAQSLGIRLPEGFGIKFRPLWQLSEKEKAEIAEIDARTIVSAEGAGLTSQKVSMMELKQSSRVTGRFTNIQQEDIDAAEETLPPAGEEAAQLEQEAAEQHATALAAGAGGTGNPKPGAAKDSCGAVTSDMLRLHDLHVLIETPKGEVRRGRDWSVIMPADYGYLRGTVGDDGDQVDCYVGPNRDSQFVMVIDQVKPLTRTPDEQKVIFGCANFAHALAVYKNGFSDGSGVQRIGGISLFNDMRSFKDWLNTKRGAPL